MKELAGPKSVPFVFGPPCSLASGSRPINCRRRKCSSRDSERQSLVESFDDFALRDRQSPYVCSNLKQSICLLSFGAKTRTRAPGLDGRELQTEPFPRRTKPHDSRRGRCTFVRISSGITEPTPGGRGKHSRPVTPSDG